MALPRSKLCRGGETVFTRETVAWAYYTLPVKSITPLPGTVQIMSRGRLALKAWLMMSSCKENHGEMNVHSYCDLVRPWYCWLRQ